MSDSNGNPSVPPVPPPPPQAQYTPPPPSQSGGSSDKTVMLILSYFGIFALIPLLVEKNDREVQWHAKHGLVLVVAEIVAFICLSVLLFVPILNILIGLFMMLMWVGVFVLHILCILKALKGERLLLPVVSDFANKF